MKKNLLFLLCIIASSTLSLAQNVPNGGFENWTSGSPNSWLANNIPTVATPVTQTTPAHTGSFAVKGTVVSSTSGNLAPLLESVDLTGTGFAVTQAYSTLSFYYKTNLLSSNSFAVLITMKDASHSLVGFAVMGFSGNVSSYTLATVPISYSGSNPVECIIELTVTDTSASGTPMVGSYFIVDDMNLSGLASVQENTSSVIIANVYPNPANHSASIQYNLAAKSDVQFQIVNAQGKNVHQINLSQQTAGKHQIDFDISSLSNGFYFVRMKTNEGISFARLQIAR